MRTPVGGPRRGGDYWQNADIAGSCDFFMQQDLPSRDTAATGRVKYGSAVMDWGDIPGGASVNGFDIAYATDVGVDPTGAGVAGFDVNIRFLDDYDGELDPGGTGASGVSVITLQDIPGGAGPGAPQGWVYVVDLEGSGLEFNWGSANLNGDSLHDFGYSYSFDQNQAGAKGVAGPFLVRPFSLGGTGTATGSVDQLDWFNGGDDLTGYTGPIWFGGGSCPARPYASTYMTVYGSIGPQTLTAFGFEHTALGAADIALMPGTQEVVVTGLSPSGQDGVSINSGDSEGVHAELHLPPTASIPVGAKLTTRLRRGADTRGQLVVERTPSGFRYTPDFSMGGSPTYSFKLLLDGAVVYQRSGVSGPAGTAAAISAAPEICSHERGGIWGTSQMCTATSWDVGGGLLITADTIAADSDTPNPTGTGDLLIDCLASGISSFSISAEFLMMFGTSDRMAEPHQAVGDAHFAATAAGLTMINLGSTGQDGVRIDFEELAGIFGIPPTRGIDIELSPIALDPGETFKVAAIGVYSGVPGTPLGHAMLRRVGGSTEVTVDFDPIGTDVVRVDVYRAGAFVTTITVPTGVVGNIPDQPLIHSCGKQSSLMGLPPCYIIRWGEPFPFDPTGPMGPIMGDELRLLAFAAPGSVDQLSSYDITGPGGSFTILGETPILEPAPCAADLNGDGIVDFSDYLEFLNFFDAQDPRADFNHDGMVDFSDYLEFLNHYDAGC